MYCLQDEFLRQKASITSEGGSVQSNKDELNSWLEVAGGKNQKGRIYGLGSETQHVVSSTNANKDVTNVRKL